MSKDKTEPTPIYLKIPPNNIVLLKFLLESYEGIAELRTLDNDQALVAILALPDTVEAVQKMLDDEKESIKWVQLDKHPNLESDWLLKSTLQETDQ